MTLSGAANSPAGRSAPRRLSRLVFILPLVAVLAVAGAYLVARGGRAALPPAIEVAPGAAAGWNVLLITLDTLRADRVGCYGYREVQTPVLDRLAAEGVRFADAVTVTPTTLPAHTSMMTGLYPPRHGVRNNGIYRLAGEYETLAKRFSGGGYATAAFLGAFVLERRFGLATGFDVYDDQITNPGGAAGDALNPQRPGNLVVDPALDWLESHARTKPERPFFVWVHLFDPHAPYTPPEPFRSHYAARPYDGEVAFTDFQVGRLMDQLDRLGLAQRTVTIAVGDHGEGLGDHGESTHSLLIYESTMHVPLIVHGPGLIPAGRVVADRVVSVVDLAPTILELVGLATWPGDGVSLLAGGADPDRATYIETLAPLLNHGWSELRGLRRHGDKYIDAPTPEYFDLHADPRELRNLWFERPRAAEELSARLADMVAELEGADVGGDATLPIDAEARRKLEALGYVGGGATSTFGPRPDPKDMIARSDAQLGTANSLVAQGRADEAIPLIRELLALTPMDASLWGLLGAAQAAAGQVDEAIESRARAIELQPHDSGAWVALGNLHYSQGDVAAWETCLAEAERLEPELGAVPLMRAVHAFQMQQYELALALCAEAARRDPVRYGARSWSLRGRVYEALGRMEEAEAAFERSRAGGTP